MKKIKSASPTNKSSKGLPNPLDLLFVYEQYSEMVASEEPSSYIRPIHGGIEFATNDAESNGIMRGTVAGCFDAIYVDADLALEEKQSLSDVMDCHSSETEEIYSALYDPESDELRKEVEELLEEPIWSNLLVINRVEILPQYRGIGLGLAVLWHLIRRHSVGCGIVAIKAFPLQFTAGFINTKLRTDWEKRMAYDSFSAGEKTAQYKLVSQYKKLSFKEIGVNGVMALSTALRRKVPKEIIRWIPRNSLRLSLLKQ